MTNNKKNASLAAINDLLAANGRSGVDMQPPAPVDIDGKRKRKFLDLAKIKDRVQAWLAKQSLTLCPASGLYFRPSETDDGREAEYVTPEYVFNQMDTEGELAAWDKLNERRFMAILKQMHQSARRAAIIEMQDRIAPSNVMPDMDRALTIARQLIRYYSDGDDEQVEINDAMMLVHELWLVKRKIFNEPDYYPGMLTLWARAEGSGKSAFLVELFKPIAPFVERSTFRIFEDKFGCAPFGLFYVLLFPEMRGVANTSIEALKEIIEQDYFTDRDMYTKLSARTMRRATCFNTSNHAPPHGMRIDGTGRRMYSIHFSEKERQPHEMEAFLRPVKLLRDELWEAIDVLADPLVDGEAFKLIRAAQREMNRPENFMLEFLETHCTKLDDLMVNDGQDIKVWQRAYKQFIFDSKYPFHGALTLARIREELERAGVVCKRPTDGNTLLIRSHRISADYLATLR